MNQQNAHTLLHLSLIPHIGPAAVLALIKGLHQEFYASRPHPELTHPNLDLTKLYSYSVTDFVEKFGVGEGTARRLVTGLADKKLLDAELSLVKKYEIDVLTFLDEAYPEDLKQIFYPPLVLYCKGEKLQNLTKRIAVVGSREADAYAYQSIAALLPHLIAHDWTIVSGGATGVDTMAHQTTVDAGGKTVVVFGSGLMHTYPEQNKTLFKTIVRNGGTLVSPFAMHMPPNRGHFPARNRVIAGLSQGCVVIQAAEKSGALITAQFALEQGRQVFALPGQINNPLSYGCNKLIQDGAKLITNTNDILEEFGEAAPTETITSPKLMHEVIEETAIIEQAAKQETNVHPIFKHIGEATSLDELHEKTSIPHEELANALFLLQLEGKVKQNFAGLWEKL